MAIGLDTDHGARIHRADPLNGQLAHEALKGQGLPGWDFDEQAAIGLRKQRNARIDEVRFAVGCQVDLHSEFPCKSHLAQRHGKTSFAQVMARDNVPFEDRLVDPLVATHRKGRIDGRNRSALFAQ